MGSSRKPRMPPQRKMWVAIRQASILVSTRLENSTRLTSGDWPKQSACLGVDTDAIFMPPVEGRMPHGHYKRAFEYCEQCPVAGECLAEALMEERHLPRDQIFGVRGGLVPQERAAIAVELGIRGGIRELQIA